MTNELLVDVKSQEENGLFRVDTVKIVETTTYVTNESDAQCFVKVLKEKINPSMVDMELKTIRHLFELHNKGAEDGDRKHISFTIADKIRNIIDGVELERTNWGSIVAESEKTYAYAKALAKIQDVINGENM